MSYYGNYVRARLADRLPRLANYREAQLWHDAVKPFSKGRSAGAKPLGRNRKYDRFKIRGEYDYKSESTEKQFIIKHYQTDILRYLADGSMFIKTDYDSISTVQGLQELLGADKFVRRKLKAYYKDRNGHFFRIKGGLKIKADGVADTTDVKPEIVHEIDRPAFKQLRERYTEFMEYVYFTNNLTQGGEAYASTLKLESVENGGASNNWYRKNASVALSIDTVQIKWYRNPQYAIREAFFAEVEAAMKLEGEDKYTAYHHLATFLSFSASTNFTGTTWNVTGDDRQYKWQVDNYRLRQFFDGLLKFRFPTLVFKEVEAEIGTIRHDTNAKYFEFGTV
jgi:hypothetical protein